MGTRSLTIFKDAGQEELDGEIAVLYRQFDGYPDGHGADLLDCLGGKTVVNGYNSDDQINGAGDMAIQVIAWLKQKHSREFAPGTAEYRPKPVNTPGQFSLHPAGTRDCWENYRYTLTCPKPGDWAANPKWEGKLHLKVESVFQKRDNEVLYDGPLDDFDPNAEREEEE
jgi:hypothetical protein